MFGEAKVAMTRWTPTYLLAPRREGYVPGEEVYLPEEDERVRVVRTFDDGTADAVRAEA